MSHFLFRKKSNLKGQEPTCAAGSHLALKFNLLHLQAFSDCERSFNVYAYVISVCSLE